MHCIHARIYVYTHMQSRLVPSLAYRSTRRTSSSTTQCDRIRYARTCRCRYSSSPDNGGKQQTLHGTREHVQEAVVPFSAAICLGRRQQEPCCGSGWLVSSTGRVLNATGSIPSLRDTPDTLGAPRERRIY